jgi:hypothetical protein
MTTPSVAAVGSSFSKNPRLSRNSLFSASSRLICVTSCSCAAFSEVSRLPAVLATDWARSRSSRSRPTSCRNRVRSSRAPASRPAMPLPNSNAHRAMAAQNPNTMAATAHRRGQGKALRTATRGALMVSRRRRSLKRMIPWQRGASIAKTEKAAPGVNLGGFVVAAKSGSALRELLGTAGRRADRSSCVPLRAHHVSRSRPGSARA